MTFIENVYWTWELFSWHILDLLDIEFSDLFEFIEKNGAAEESVAHRIFTQLVSAVRYLARNQIIHRDIKDENIIIDPNLNIELIGKKK